MSSPGWTLLRFEDVVGGRESRGGNVTLMPMGSTFPRETAGVGEKQSGGGSSLSLPQRTTKSPLMLEMGRERHGKDQTPPQPSAAPQHPPPR